jgi:hypothetical protein
MKYEIVIQVVPNPRGGMNFQAKGAQYADNDALVPIPPTAIMQILSDYLVGVFMRNMGADSKIVSDADEIGKSLDQPPTLAVVGSEYDEFSEVHLLVDAREDGILMNSKGFIVVAGNVAGPDGKPYRNVRSLEEQERVLTLLDFLRIQALEFVAIQTQAQEEMATHEARSLMNMKQGMIRA